CGVLGQNVLSTTSTVPPEAIVNLDDDDFQLFLAGREPKAFSGSTTSSNSSVTTSTTARTTTPPMTPRTTTPPTTTTSPRPPRPNSTTSTTTTTRTPMMGGNSWLEEGTTTADSTNTLDRQFQQANEDFAQLLQLEQDLPSETSTILSTPPRPQRPMSTPSTTSVPKMPVIGGSSWLEEGTPTAPNSDVLGQQFQPASHDFTKWVMQQMNKQEVAFVPQHVPMCSERVQEGVAWSSTASPTTVAPFAAFSSGQPGGHQEIIHSQLQTSQQLTDGLLTLWTPSGSYIPTDGQRYTPPAVSHQTVTYGNDGVSHNNHYQIQHHQDLQQQQQQLAFPGFSHSTPTYFSHQNPASQPGPQSTTSSDWAPIAIDDVPASDGVFYSDGNYYYTQPEAPPPPQFPPYELQHFEEPFSINY
ncbi:uncharacterized protein LOC128266938, partial [Anopheles cruzii]|uniref:uncharacterized protein LOC128266938 n=1 Tax=Anopheles cruzii TaxID=68878 RepID=UPI0022EC4A20